MKVYTYSQARQQLSELLNYAEKEEVLIRRRDGRTFAIVSKQVSSSPFDISGLDTDVVTDEILSAIQESRETYE